MEQTYYLPAGTSVIEARMDPSIDVVRMPFSVEFGFFKESKLDVDRFIGIPYDVRHMDCADLVLLVQRELFGREVLLPGKRPRPLRADEQDAAIAAYSAQLADPVEQPHDGDAVLMREIGAQMAGHIGTYFFLNFTPYVLHTTALLGGSVLHRLHELPATGLTVEGFYRWK